MQSSDSIPQSLEAEKGLLACLLLEWDEVMDMLAKPPAVEWFSSRTHKLLFETCSQMSAQNIPISASTALQRLTDAGHIDIHKNIELFNEMFSAVVTRAQAPYFAGVVQEKHRLRCLHEKLNSALAKASSAGAKSDDLISEVEAELFRISDTSDGDLDATSFGQYVDNITSNKVLHGISTGVGGLDFLLGGWRQRLLYAVAARPGIGKTSLAVQSMIEAWRAGKSVLFFSADMADEESWLKVACQSCGVNSYLFLKGLLPNDGPKVKDYQRKMMESGRFHICGLSQPTADQVFSITRSHRRRHSVELVAFDYYTCIGIGRDEKPLEAFTRAADTFRTVARECNVALVVLAQLNRAGAGEPQAEHIKDCDALLAACDAAVLLWSDKPPEDIDEPIKHYFRVAKNRYGPRGMCEAKFDGKITTYIKDDPRAHP